MFLDCAESLYDERFEELQFILLPLIYVVAPPNGENWQWPDGFKGELYYYIQMITSQFYNWI